MSDTAIIIMLAVLAITAVLIMWIWRKLFGSREHARNDEYSKRFLARLQAPDYKVVEDYFGVELPAILKGFYSSPLITGDYVVFSEDGDEWDIAFFQPIDEESTREGWPGMEPYLAIANDGCGNDYIFDPKLPPFAVKFHDHETSEIDPVSETLEDFIRMIEVNYSPNNLS